MRRIIIASLLLLGISSAFGVTIEKNDISIQYEKCFKYRTIKFDAPNCIKITNLSNKAIVVDPCVISAPLVAYQKVVKALRNEYKFGAILTTLLTAGAGSLSYFMFKSMRDSNALYNSFSGTDLRGKKVIYDDTPLWAKINLGSAIGGGFLTTYFLYKLITETGKVLQAKLEKEILHTPITIQPGESIEKLFWLKNPKDQVKINFEAIKVLK